MAAVLTWKTAAVRARHARLLQALAFFCIAGCSDGPKPETAPSAKIDGEAVVFAKGSPQLASLVLEAAEQRPAAAVRLNGRLAWNEERTVRIYTPFAGRVSSIVARAGERVQRGQALAVIASPDFGQAQAEARRAQGDYALAQQNLARLRDLHQHGVAAARDLNAAEAEFARAEAEYKRTEARLRMYGGGGTVDQTYTLISPLAGAVVERNINPGQEVRPDLQAANAPALFVISDPGSLWVLLDASEKDLGGLAPGSVLTVRVPAYPDAEFEAKVATIADFLDPTTRTIRVRATIDNTSRRLKAEMFVNAEVRSNQPPVVKVPARAVIFQGGRHYLFVEESEGRFARREVGVGEAGEGSVAIQRGVAAGEKVVAEGALLLQQVLQPRRVVK